MIRYDKKWFNPLYFELRKYEAIPSVRIILVYGGKGSAKTVSISQLLSGKCVAEKKNIMGFRKESARIQTTLKKSFELAIESMRLSAGFRPYEFSFKSHKMSEIVLKGLDNQEKAKGIESFDYILFDELNQFEQEEFEQANLSLRGRPGQKIFATWNPVSSSSWVKKELIDKNKFHHVSHTLPCEESFVQVSEDGKIVLIKTSYPDNYWIVGSPCGSYGFHDENLIYEYESLKTKNPMSYRVNVKGDWGIEDPEKLFIRNFSHERHVKPVIYERSQDLYLTFDLNYDPRCLVIHKGEFGPRVIKNYGAKGLTLPHICAQIKRDFNPDYVFINGDASGHYSRNLTDNATSYEIIKENFGLSWSQFNVPKANPTHRRSRLQCNAIADFGAMEIDPGCTDLIEDIESAVVDVNGSLDPWKKDNPDRSHWLDPLRYHVAAEYNDVVKLLGFGE